MSCRRLSLLSALAALVVAPAALAAKSDVGASAKLSGSGTSYTLTIRNTSNAGETILCFKLFLRPPVQITQVQGPAGWSVMPLNIGIGGAAGQTATGVPPGGTATFTFTTDQPIPATADSGVLYELVVSQTCQPNSDVRAQINPAPLPPTDPCRTQELLLDEIKAELAAEQAKLTQLQGVLDGASRKADLLSEKLAGEKAGGAARTTLQPIRRELHSVQLAESLAKKAIAAARVRIHQLVESEKDAETNLATCRAQHPSGFRVPAAARRGADCSQAEEALATANGQAAAYADLVRRFSRVDLPGAVRKLNDVAARLRKAGAAAPPGAVALAAAAAAAFRSAAVALADLKSASANATQGVTKAKSDLASCQATGG